MSGQDLGEGLGDLVEVTQEDRAAAADYFAQVYGYGEKSPTLADIRNGRPHTDSAALVQAFARHRINSCREAADLIKALVEIVAKAATRFDHCADMIAESFSASGTLRAERTVKARHYALEARQALPASPAALTKAEPPLMANDNLGVGEHPSQALIRLIPDDPDYAWAWHCNIAVPIMDAAGVSHEIANVTAAHLMQHLFDCDITAHPHYRYDKSGAQAYAEMRIAAEREEDATLTKEGGNRG